MSGMEKEGQHYNARKQNKEPCPAVNIYDRGTHPL